MSLTAQTLNLTSAMVKPHLGKGLRIQPAIGMSEDAAVEYDFRILIQGDFEQSAWLNPNIGNHQLALIQAITFNTRGEITAFGQEALNPVDGEESIIVWQEHPSLDLQSTSDVIPIALKDAFIEFPSAGPCLS